MKITDRRFALGCGIGYAVYRVKKATGSIRLIRRASTEKAGIRAGI
jgi:hypothetical protein